jgi:hypothetical protein
MKDAAKFSIIILVALSLCTNNFSYAQTLPKDFKEAKEMGEQAIETGKETVPQIVLRSWKEEVLPVWKGMYQWFLVNVWSGVFKQEVEPRVLEEYERRKAIVREELPKEEQEIREELPTLWERFMKLWDPDNSNI